MLPKQDVQLPTQLPKNMTYDSQYDFKYPKDGVKGIYLTAYSTKNEKFQELIKLINDTELNAMVIDVKDDHGNITMSLDTNDPLIEKYTLDVTEAKTVLKEMEKNNIYPIARIVTFKDTALAQDHPEWSFKENGKVWQNDGGDSFVNPYLKEVWDYNVNVAKEAAKLGFKDIQFDYVRFPEGFENKASSLEYDKGPFKDSDKTDTEQRVESITNFVNYAHQELKPYGVEVSADVFGYTALVKEASGIGQSFPQISKHVDAISAMIYPSHWSPGDFGLDAPDTEPYKATKEYIERENAVLDELGKQKPKSRPWLQDFTASYLGAGQYKDYNQQEIEDQIKALEENDIHEFLLWNAANDYTEGVDYTPTEKEK
nr:putative glycoside hydrolase [Staphylococcus canis]